MSHGFSTSPRGAGPADAKALPQARRRLYFWALCGALGGFLFGYDTGVVSGALLFIRKDFDLGSFAQGAVVSILLLGAVVGAPIAARLADRYGRRPTLLIIAAIFAFGLGLAALSPNVGVLLVARAVLGLAVGGASAIVPIYLSEIAPTRLRGTLTSMNQLMVVVGILISYAIGLALSASGNWRLMFAAGVVAAVLMFAGMLVVPESPVWLAGHGHSDRATKVLERLTTPEDAERLVKVYLEPSAGDQGKPRVSVPQMLRNIDYRPALIVGLTLAAGQQFAGINTVVYYAPTIMEKTGLNASNALVYSIIIGSINLVMTVLAMRLMDKAGRRPLLLFSTGLMALATVPLGLSFVALSGTTSSVAALLSILVYIAAFAVGLGPVFWLLNSELYPADIRAGADALGTQVNWLSNFVVSQAFLPLTAAIGEGQTFWLFGVVCVLLFLFCLKRVPETKGRSTAEIGDALKERA